MTKQINQTLEEKNLSHYFVKNIGKIMYIVGSPKNDEEKKIAEKVLNEMNKKLDGKVSTRVSKEKNYCKAEEYHQKFMEKRR